MRAGLRGRHGRGPYHPETTREVKIAILGDSQNAHGARLDDTKEDRIVSAASWIEATPERSNSFHESL
jgi:hypothetical protein